MSIHMMMENHTSLRLDTLEIEYAICEIKDNFTGSGFIACSNEHGLETYSWNIQTEDWRQQVRRILNTKPPLKEKYNLQNSAIEELSNLLVEVGDIIGGEPRHRINNLLEKLNKELK